MKKKIVEKKKFWIKTTKYICPVCNRETVYKERKYTKKPEEYSKRNILLVDGSCYCIYDWGVFHDYC